MIQSHISPSNHSGDFPDRSRIKSFDQGFAGAASDSTQHQDPDRDLQLHFGFRFNCTFQSPGCKAQISLGVNNLTWQDSVRLYNSQKTFTDISLIDLYKHYEGMDEAARRTELRDEANQLSKDLTMDMRRYIKPSKTRTRLVARDTPTSSAPAATSTWPYGEHMRAVAATIGEVPFQGITLAFLFLFVFKTSIGVNTFEAEVYITKYVSSRAPSGMVPSTLGADAQLFSLSWPQPYLNHLFSWEIDALTDLVGGSNARYAPLVRAPVMYTVLKAIWVYLDRTQRLDPYYALIARILLAIAAASKKAFRIAKTLPAMLQRPAPPPRAIPAIELTNITVQYDNIIFIPHNKTSNPSGSSRHSSIVRVPRPVQTQQTLVNRFNHTLEEIVIDTGDDHDDHDHTQ